MAKKAAVAEAAKGKPAKAAPARSTAATLEGVLAQLQSLGDAARRAHNSKYGAGDNQYGVKSGDLRTIANKIKTNHDLAMALWKTGNVDAQALAALVVNVKELSADALDRMVRSTSFAHVADWLMSYVVKQ